MTDENSGIVRSSFLTGLTGGQTNTYVDRQTDRYPVTFVNESIYYGEE